MNELAAVWQWPQSAGSVHFNPSLARSAPETDPGAPTSCLHRRALTFPLTSNMAAPAITTGLNEAQRAAVTSPAAVIQILAPPGSGKTKTLTSRVSHLLQHHGYRPWNVICLTFTIKSAREMRERIAKQIGNGLESKIVLGTFHSVCLRYLRAYGDRISLPKSFSIADASDSQAIINRLVKQHKLTIEPKAARSRISHCKARIERYQDQRHEGKKKNVDQQEFAYIYEPYESHLEVSQLLDYDDLLLRCTELLRLHPECVANIEAVLIDEFQDTNLVQFELMTLFAQQYKRITTVGDPDQSIYGWRNAEVANLTKMQRKYPETMVVHLEDNYRSSGSILFAALQVIKQDTARPAKPLLPTHCTGTAPTLRQLPHAAAEAQWIVSEIKRCMSLTDHQLLEHSDFAILLRSASLSRQIESVMGRVGLPYRMVGGARFFDRTEIKILLDYLRVISQPENTEALARVVNVPSRRIGDVTIKGLLEEANTKAITLWQIIQKFVQGHSKPRTKITSVAEKGFAEFYNIIMTARKRMLAPETFCSPKDTLTHIINKLDFKSHLKQYHPEDHEQRWTNVEELLAQASGSQAASTVPTDGEGEDLLSLPPQEDCIDAATIHAAGLASDSHRPSSAHITSPAANPSNHPPDASTSDTGAAALSNFLENVALSTEHQRTDDELDAAGREKPRVTISTIHAAKGLEWPVVFIPSVYSGSIPHSRAEDYDEERRLLYVAMTRAQALLYLSVPKRNSTSGEETTMSPFVTSSSVHACFAEQGPSFQSETTSTVADIARILRRACPSPQALHNGRKSADNVEDTLWPLDGTEDPEHITSRWNNTKPSTYPLTDNLGSKRKAHGEDLVRQSVGFQPASKLSITHNTTMQQQKSFTITPHASGFVSASTKQLHPAPLSKSAKPSLKRQKSNPPSSQGSLTSFFKPVPALARSATSPTPSGPTPQRHDQPKSIHTSSTPSGPTLQRHDQPESAHDNVLIESDAQYPTHHLMPAASASTAFEPRPAMATLSSAATNVPKEPKKLLGMRRTATGWNGQGARPFKPPLNPRPHGQ